MVAHPMDCQPAKRAAVKALAELPKDMAIDEASDTILEAQRKAIEAAERQFSKCDKMVQSPYFEDYLESRELQLLPLFPPALCDYRAEQAALSAMLYATSKQGLIETLMPSQEAIELGLRRLRYHHLQARRLHEPILRALAVCQQQKAQGKLKVIDFVVVCNALQRAQAFDSDGGPLPYSYLSSLIEACPTALNMGSYIDAVIEMWRLRALHQLSLHIKDAALMPNADAGHIAIAIKNAVDAIERGDQPNFIHLFTPHK